MSSDVFAVLVVVVGVVVVVIVISIIVVVVDTAVVEIDDDVVVEVVTVSVVVFVVPTFVFWPQCARSVHCLCIQSESVAAIREVFIAGESNVVLCVGSIIRKQGAWSKRSGGMHLFGRVLMADASVVALRSML